MEQVLSIGLMSGAAGEGIDIALIETDAYEHVRPLVFQTHPYTDGIRELLGHARDIARRMPIPGPDPLIDEAASLITSLHLEAIRKLLASSGFDREEIEVIGLHGHSIAHRPDMGMTWQIGDGNVLATESRIRVVSDFGKADRAAGGMGAPLFPVFFRALTHELPKPFAVVDLGKTARLTALYTDNEICAFDCGAGMALLDAWTLRHAGSPYDVDGSIASQGRVNEEIVEHLIAHPYFRRAYPKSINIDDFGLDAIEELGLEDGMATLCAFAAEGIVRGLLLIAQRPDKIWLTGGGRKNAALQRMISARTGVPVGNIDAMGWNGDALDAQAVAYLAVRRLAMKASTYPETTGVTEPLSCGMIHEPMDRRSISRD